MLENVVDCDVLGVVPDYPTELFQLGDRVKGLKRSNQYLLIALIVIVLMAGYIIYSESKGRKKEVK